MERAAPPAVKLGAQVAQFIFSEANCEHNYVDDDEPTSVSSSLSGEAEDDDDDEDEDINTCSNARSLDCL